MRTILVTSLLLLLCPVYATGAQTLPSEDGAYMLLDEHWQKLNPATPQLKTAGGLLSVVSGTSKPDPAKRAGELVFNGRLDGPTTRSENITVAFVGTIPFPPPSLGDYPQIEAVRTEANSNGTRHAPMAKVGNGAYGFGDFRVRGSVEKIGSRAVVLRIDGVLPAGTYAVTCANQAFEFGVEAPATVTTLAASGIPAQPAPAGSPVAASTAPKPESTSAPVNSGAFKEVIGVPWGSAPEVSETALKKRGTSTSIYLGEQDTNVKIVVGKGGSFAGQAVSSWNFIHFKNRLYQVQLSFKRPPMDGRADLDYRKLSKMLVETYGGPVDIANEIELKAYEKNMLEGAEVSYAGKYGLEMQRFLMSLKLKTIQPRSQWVPGVDGSTIQIALVSDDETILVYTSATEIALVKEAGASSAAAQKSDL